MLSINQWRHTACFSFCFSYPLILGNQIQIDVYHTAKIVQTECNQARLNCRGAAYLMQ